MNSDAITPPALPSEIFDALPAPVRAYIRYLEETVVRQQVQIFALTSQVQTLTSQVQTLTLKVKDLEGQLAKNSSNSSKPPGSDGLKKQQKTNSLRGKSGKKPGGQPGRIGKTLEQVPNPEYVEVHAPESCKNCQGSLKNVEACGVEKRQVFDLPKVEVFVVEHQAEIKMCPCCGHKTKGVFPVDVRGVVQYGAHVQALAAYFAHQHLVPFDRLAQIFEDIYGIPLSPGTCSNMDKRLFNRLEVFEKNLKIHLLSCAVLHFDETGVRCEKKLNWIHVASSTTATFYGLHRKRGQEAIDAHGILPLFMGTAVHDHWFPYFTYAQVRHVLCNAHHLRELKYVHEQEGAKWAGEMIELLVKANNQTEAARLSEKGVLEPLTIVKIKDDYECLLLKAYTTYLGSDESVGVIFEGQKKSGFNLFKRLLRKMSCVLGFLEDPDIPFTNNLAEQDLRMEKVKQKISGCFRTFTGGVISCRVRSYISTARKQGWRIIDSLAEAVRGFPHLLPV